MSRMSERMDTLSNGNTATINQLASAGIASEKGAVGSQTSARVPAESPTLDYRPSLN